MILMSHTDQMILMTDTDHLIRMTHLDHLIRMCYIDHVMDTDHMIRMKSEHPKHQKQPLTKITKTTKLTSTTEAVKMNGDVLNADNRSTQQRRRKPRNVPRINRNNTDLDCLSYFLMASYSYNDDETNYRKKSIKYRRIKKELRVELKSYQPYWLEFNQ